MNTVVFTTNNLHLNSGEIVPGSVCCTPGEPMEVILGRCTKDSIRLPDSVHVSLGRCDPHVHFRESAIPTHEEFEEHRTSDQDYEDFVDTIRRTNHLYNIDMGSLAALKGGVSTVGAMGNIPWSPVGEYRHQRTQSHYHNRSRVLSVVWPRIEPGVKAIAGHEGKDFGSTFGGSGISGEERAEMYKLWAGEAVSFHNDQARDDQTIEEFKESHQPADYLLHHLYYDESTVLACQKETVEIARKAGVSSLLARHIPTGSALQHWFDQGKEGDMAMPMEVGLDYLYWNRDMLEKRPLERSLINFRRPAHPSENEQSHLIELMRDLARLGENIFIGSDHAPHPLANKQFTNGLPGSPGTRCIEHSLQYHMHLYRNYGYTMHDIDLLTSINPIVHMAQFHKFPHPVGKMETGYLCNLSIFDTKAPYQVSESNLRETLRDPEYHSLLTGEENLFGKNLYTVVNGTVYSVEKEVYAVN